MVSMGHCVAKMHCSHPEGVFGFKYLKQKPRLIWLSLILTKLEAYLGECAELNLCNKDTVFYKFVHIGNSSPPQDHSRVRTWKTLVQIHGRAAGVNIDSQRTTTCWIMFCKTLVEKGGYHLRIHCHSWFFQRSGSKTKTLCSRPTRETM
jgi:hypothetical protein